MESSETTKVVEYVSSLFASTGGMMQSEFDKSSAMWCRK